jgi:recombination protein RecR
MQNDLEKLISLISKLPSIGKRSAKRVALHLLKHKESLMFPLAQAIQDTAKNIRKCVVCDNYDVKEICSICNDYKRDKSIICIVENVEDLWAIERGNIYTGVYHILGGTLSAINGTGPDELNINNLENRLKSGEVKEIIIATNATLEGQTTAHFLANRLKNYSIKISRIAFGIPLGGELDFLDEGTLLTSFETRRDMV